MFQTHVENAIKRAKLPDKFGDISQMKTSIITILTKLN